MKRGRDYTDETSGATEFFREVENQIAIQAKNPVFDSVLETSAKFATELALLDRETGLYQADVSRARRAVVMIQKAGPGTEFGKWFGDVTSKPLFGGDTAEEQDGLIANPTHFCPTGKFSAQVDGIYLRDPECLLFKEWARLDRENSPSGEGFVFMAIAYSKLRSGGKINDSDYDLISAWRVILSSHPWGSPDFALPLGDRIIEVPAKPINCVLRDQNAKTVPIVKPDQYGPLV